MMQSGFIPEDNICWRFNNKGDPWRCGCPACEAQYGKRLLVFFGRCRSGKRWFWSAQTFDDPEKLAHGIADTETEATDAAMAAVRGFRDGRPLAANFSPGTASYHLRQLNKEKRAARPPSNAKDTPVVEYLYRGWHQRHQIVKRTKQRIYYLKKGEAIDEHGEPIDPGNILDYSNGGKVGFKTYKYLEADARRYPRFYFTSLEDLLAERDRQRRLWPGLEQPDLAALRQAMVAAHPDKGGSSAAFIEARAAYVAARRMQRGAACR